MIRNKFLKYLIECNDEWISERLNKDSYGFWGNITVNPNIDIEYMLENTHINWKWNWIEDNPRLTYKNSIKVQPYMKRPWTICKILDLESFYDDSELSTKKSNRSLNKCMEIRRMPMEKIIEMYNNGETDFFYEIVLENPNLTDEYIIKLCERLMKNNMYCNGSRYPRIFKTEKYVHRFPQVKWDIDSVIMSSHTSWNTILSDPNLESNYKAWIYRPCIPYFLFKKYREQIAEHINYYYMTCIKQYVSFNIIIDDDFLKDEFGSGDLNILSDSIWCFNYICSNYSLTWEHIKFLEKYIRTHHIYQELISSNPVITWEIVKNNRNFPWKTKGILKNPNFGLEEIKGFEKLFLRGTISLSGIASNLFNRHPYFVSDNYIQISSKKLVSEFIQKCGEELSAIACHPTRMANWHEDMSGEMEDLFNMEIERWKLFDSSNPEERIIGKINRDVSVNIMARKEQESADIVESHIDIKNIKSISKKETRRLSNGVKLPFIGVKPEKNTLYANIFDKDSKLKKKTCVYKDIDFYASKDRLIKTVIDYYNKEHDIILGENDIDMRFTF